MRVVTFDRPESVLPPPSVARIDPWTFFYLLGGNKGYQLEDIVDVTSPSSELFPHALDWQQRRGCDRRARRRTGDVT